MKYTDIKGLAVRELEKKKRDIAEELFHAKMKNSLGQLGNSLSIRALRRDMARVLMALSETRKVSK